MEKPGRDAAGAMVQFLGRRACRSFFFGITSHEALGCGFLDGCIFYYSVIDSYSEIQEEESTWSVILDHHFGPPTL
ncbi:hypothetical protein NDU88_002993 [Pleurodeles waltl]|uniref:Uncharacterized protein n=1 Tax=Pleurodeles waltl TaxID=8319 RepID=A0AAV7LH78_PLEWA|nr:hypothetical protein NDU88_002993 [Pleurodeles waltl]